MPPVHKQPPSTPSTRLVVSKDTGHAPRSSASSTVASATPGPGASPLASYGIVVSSRPQIPSRWAGEAGGRQKPGCGAADDRDAARENVGSPRVGQRLVDHHGAVRAARDPDLLQIHAQHLLDRFERV